jgi:hypothetical protein
MQTFCILYAEIMQNITNMCILRTFLLSYASMHKMNNADFMQTLCRLVSRNGAEIVQTIIHVWIWRTFLLSSVANLKRNLFQLGKCIKDRRPGTDSRLFCINKWAMCWPTDHPKKRGCAPSLQSLHLAHLMHT